MNNPLELPPDLEAIAVELDRYNRERFHVAKERMHRRQTAKNMDGEYSLLRALNGALEGRLNSLAPYEAACSDRIAEACNKPPLPGHVYVPLSGRRRRWSRDLTSDNSTAAYLVGTDTAPGDYFVDVLDESLDLEALGIRRMILQRPCTVPAVGGNISTQWLSSEGVPISQDDFVFAQSAASPKSVAAYLKCSDRWFKQTSPAAHQFVFRALARAVAAELSRKILMGSGTNGEIKGLHAISGVGQVQGGSLNYDVCLQALSAVEASNALLLTGTPHFVMPPSVAAKARTRTKFSNTDTPLLLGAEMIGFPAIVTAAASPNSLCFGNFAGATLLEFSALQVGVDPYGVGGGSDFAAGLIGLRCVYDVDFLVPQPECFAVTGTLS